MNFKRDKNIIWVVLATGITVLRAALLIYAPNLTLDWATPIGLALFLGRYGYPSTLPIHILVADIGIAFIYTGIGKSKCYTGMN